VAKYSQAFSAFIKTIDFQQLQWNTHREPSQASYKAKLIGLQTSNKRHSRIAGLNMSIINQHNLNQTID
jgi:hypothetical protein